ncbi:MAG: Sir2 family NAD+-dependent deacetylase [Pseudomonadales bacterium]
MAGLPSIVVLTGAGISAESSIKTFRAADGLWENHRVEDVASPEGFARNPELVQRFYNDRRRQLLHGDIAPNAGHIGLANFERQWGGGFLLVTQNVDNLHEEAGSERILHMHGELLKMRCTACATVFDINGDIAAAQACDCCAVTGTLRPDIVWFGEMPMAMDEVYTALTSCDIFVAIGTSGNVYPAAGFVQWARNAGAETVELNIEPSEAGSAFAEGYYGPATIEVDKYFGNLLRKHQPK